MFSEVMYGWAKSSSAQLLGQLGLLLGIFLLPFAHPDIHAAKMEALACLVKDMRFRLILFLMDTLYVLLR